MLQAVEQQELRGCERNGVGVVKIVMQHLKREGQHVQASLLIWQAVEQQEMRGWVRNGVGVVKIVMQHLKREGQHVQASLSVLQAAEQQEMCGCELQNDADLVHVVTQRLIH
jgi:hypothetical protein